MALARSALPVPALPVSAILRWLGRNDPPCIDRTSPSRRGDPSPPATGSRHPVTHRGGVTVRRLGTQRVCQDFHRRRFALQTVVTASSKTPDMPSSPSLDSAFIISCRCMEVSQAVVAAAVGTGWMAKYHLFRYSDHWRPGRLRDQIATKNLRSAPQLPITSFQRSKDAEHGGGSWWSGCRLRSLRRQLLFDQARESRVNCHLLSV